MFMLKILFIQYVKINSFITVVSNSICQQVMEEPFFFFTYFNTNSKMNKIKIKTKIFEEIIIH